MQLPSESVLEGSRSLSYGNTRSTKGKQEETLLLSRRTTCDCLLVKCVFRNDGNRLSSANQNGGYDPTYIMRLKLHRAYGSEESIKRHSVTQPPSCVLNAITAHHPHQHTRIHGWTGGYPSVSPFSPSGPRSSLVM